VTVDAPEVETVGRFEMTVALAEPAPEVAQRWSSRADALAGWLLAEWRRDQGEAN